MHPHEHEDRETANDRCSASSVRAGEGKRQTYAAAFQTMGGMRSTVVLAALLLLAVGLAPAGVTQGLADANVPDASDLHQDDGGSGADAPDGCAEAVDGGPAIEAGGSSKGGQLVYAPREVENASGLGDRQDHWQLPLEQAGAEGQINLSIATSSPGRLGSHAGLEVAVAVLEPGCEEVLADTVVEHDDLEILSFQPEQSGNHAIRLVERGPQTAVGALDDLVPGPTQASGHCRPYCASEYHLQIAS